MNQKAALLITSDKEKIRITSLDGEIVFFEGDDEQAWRVLGFVGPIVGGGNLYAYYEGEISQVNHCMLFLAKDVAGLGTTIEIEFDGEIKKVSLSW